MMLGQLLPDALKGIDGWLLCAGCVLWLYVLGRDAFSRKQPNPPNEQLEQSVKLLTDTLHSHMEMNRQDHRDLFAKIGGVERGAQSKLEAAIESGNVSREKLHERINDLMRAISRLEGKLEK